MTEKLFGDGPTNTQNSTCFFPILKVFKKATIWGIYKKLPLRQLTHLNSTLITYLTDTTDSNTIDVANDLMIAICNNIHSRGLNSMHAAMNLVKGLESESTECRTACLGALNKLLPQHGIDDETTAIEDYLSHR